MPENKNDILARYAAEIFKNPDKARSGASVEVDPSKYAGGTVEIPLRRLFDSPFRNYNKGKDFKKVKDDFNLFNKNLFSTYGIEYTYVYDNKREKKSYYKSVKSRDDRNDRVYSVLCDIKLEMKHTKVGGTVHNDEGAIEINSPAFSSLEEGQIWYKKMTKVVNKYPLYAHNQVECSGGGHIHVKIPDKILKCPLKTALWLSNLYKLVTNHPELNWVFNEWCNRDSASSFARIIPDKKTELNDIKNNVYSGGGYCGEIVNFIWPDMPRIEIATSMDRILDAFGVSKGYALRVDPADKYQKKPTTVEFRFFDAKKSWKQVELEVNFVDALLKHVTMKSFGLDPDISRHEYGRRTYNFRLDKRNLDEVNEFGQTAYGETDEVLEHFKKLLTKLGLKYEDYRGFVESNYIKRKQEKFLNENRDYY